MRAALYCRVSTDEQAEKFGLSSQLHELRAFATEHGYTVPHGAEYLDDGYSGVELERPALARLREAARAHTVDVVLVHDTDRLSRRLVHQLVLIEEFEKAGVRVEYKTTPREDTPEGQLLLNVKGAVAEYERLKIRERTMRGKREKARRGLVPSGPTPFGYRRDPEQLGRLVIHEDEARVLKLIFSRLLDDQRSIRKIAEELERAGYPAPRGSHWVPSTVKRLAQSEVYAGKMWFNRQAWAGTKRRERPQAEWISIPVPAIVQIWQVERAKEQMKRNATVHSGRPSPRFYLLRGLLICEACGRPWASWPSHGRRRYRCTSRNRWYSARSCDSPSRKAEDLESLVWETVAGVLRDPTLLASKMEGYRLKLGVRDVEMQSEAAYVNRQLVELDRQERRLLALYLESDALESPVVRAKAEEFKARRQALRAREGKLKAQAAQDAALEARQDAVASYCALALRGLDALTPEGRHQLLLTLVDRVVVSRHGLEIHGVLPGRSADRKPLRVSA
jgi:site-specific DNA recombinase